MPAKNAKTIWTPEMLALIGTASDAEIANKIGVSRPVVSTQ
jgi:hypothetical protein